MRLTIAAQAHSCTRRQTGGSLLSRISLIVAFEMSSIAAPSSPMSDKFDAEKVAGATVYLEDSATKTKVSSERRASLIGSAWSISESVSIYKDSASCSFIVEALRMD